MINNKNFIYGIIGLAIGAILMYFGEGTPPADRIYTLGLLFIALSAFYLVMAGAIKFTLYMLKMRGYIKEKDE